MIPSAQVLCEILNDPAIPAEAKPSDIHGRDWIVREGELVCLGEWYKCDRINAALFWSLSAWMWNRDGVAEFHVDRGGAPTGVWAAHVGGAFEYTTIERAPTPVEAVAAAVRIAARAVAAQGVRA